MAQAANMALMSPTNYNSKKKTDGRNLNQSINIRSNKKAMNPNARKQSEKQEVQIEQTPTPDSESDVSLDLPSMRSEIQQQKPKPQVIECNLRIDTTMKAFEKQGGSKKFEENLASGLGLNMSQVQVTGLRAGSVIVDYNLVVDKSSKISIDELKTLQNEKMKAGAIEVGGPVLSFSSTVPTSGSDEPHPKSNKRIAEPIPTESFSGSEHEIEDASVSEPSARKKQQPPEPE